MNIPDLPLLQRATQALLAVPKEHRGMVLVWFCDCGKHLEPLEYRPCSDCKEEDSK